MHLKYDFACELLPIELTYRTRRRAFLASRPLADDSAAPREFRTTRADLKSQG